MPSKSAVFMSTVFISGLALVTFVRPGYSENERCLARPGSAAPSGHHWYYTIDRETHRKCWILAPEGLIARPRQSLSEKAVPPRKPQTTVSSALNTANEAAVVGAQRGDPPLATASPAQIAAAGNYRTASLSSRPIDVASGEWFTGSGGGTPSAGVTEDDAKALEDEPQAMETTRNDTNIAAAALSVGETAVADKEQSPLRAMLMLFAGTLLASGVARLVFKLSGTPSL